MHQLFHQNHQNTFLAAVHRLFAHHIHHHHFYYWLLVTGYLLLVTCYWLLVTCCLDTTFTKQVLLILTDGEITDMDNTRNAIIRACNLPISILIVGVGSCEFEKMNLLDGDDGALTASDGYTKAR